MRWLSVVTVCCVCAQVGWGWKTIHEINGAIDWSKWPRAAAAACCAAEERQQQAATT